MIKSIINDKKIMINKIEIRKKVLRDVIRIDNKSNVLINHIDKLKKEIEYIEQEYELLYGI